MKLDSRRAREISDFVNNRVKILDVLKDSGLKLVLTGATWKALCPFHDDKDTASFTVKLDYNYVHCFGCDQTWFPVKFVMDYEKKTWGEAIKQLSRAYSLNMSAFEKNLTSHEKTIDEAKKLNQSACDWLYKQTAKYPKAKEYLLSRYDQKTIDKWQLGYCLKGDRLIEHLIKKCRYDYNLIKKADIQAYMFDDRIVYPIFDMYGGVVGFSCRVWALSKEEETKKYKKVQENKKFRKFINTSGKSILFKYKSSNLYGLNFARKSLRKSKGTILLVEGCSDVILMHKHGFENCAGVLSAAFNQHSLKTLASVGVQKVVFCLDGDSVGQARTLDLMADKKQLINEMPDNALQIQFRAITIPDGQDPDEFLSINSNTSKMKKLIDNSLSLAEFYINYKKKNSPEMETITQKTDFLFNIRKELAPYLQRAEMTLIANHLLKEFGIPQSEYYEYVNLRNNKLKLKKTEEKILSWLIEDADFRNNFINSIFKPKMFNSGYSSLFRIIRELHNNKLPLASFDELNENIINIDSIITRAKQLRIVSFFGSTKELKSLLMKISESKKGLLQEFKSLVKQKRIKDFTSKLNSLINQNTSEELIDYIKDSLEELEVIK